MKDPFVWIVISFPIVVIGIITFAILNDIKRQESFRKQCPIQKGMIVRTAIDDSRVYYCIPCGIQPMEIK